MKKSCFFIGHRETTQEIYPALAKAVERHITEYGVEEFVVGRHGGFEWLAARAVAEAKKRHPHITLLLLLPYHPGERPVELPEGFDNSFYPDGMERVPKRYAIVRANRYMVDHADYLISYVWHPASNAREVVEYALRKGTIRVENLKRSE